MNIKSLLLGSAAVLVAASTAQAADAIIVEPEPVEYVRICDAYGTGFFYIPGTETCLKLGGNIRSTFKHVNRETAGVDDLLVGQWNYRGRFNFDARNETDWGTLRSYLQLEGSGGNPGGAVGIQTLEISVAGFRLGTGDGYWATGHGYGSTPAIDSGWYGFVANKYFDYTFAADNFSLTVGVSDAAANATLTALNALAGLNEDDTPDYYIGGTYSDSWGSISATYVHDSDAVTRSATGVVLAGVGSSAWKVSGVLSNVGDSGWNISAQYAHDGDDVTDYITNQGGGAVAGVYLETDHIWRVGIDGSLADDLTGYVSYSVADSDDTVAKGVGVGFNDASQWAVGLVWSPISGLSIQTEYMAGESDFGTDNSADEDWDRWSVRITRSW